MRLISLTGMRLNRDRRGRWQVTCRRCGNRYGASAKRLIDAVTAMVRHPRVRH